MVKIKQSDFYPVNSLEDKNNYKRIYTVKPDGSIIERIVLDIPDVAHREQLICLHYLQQLVRYFLSKPVEVKILGRDKPWDFKLELSSGQKFNLEITAIADSPKHFEKDKKEERLAMGCVKDSIPLHELKKLNALFPNSEIEDIIHKHDSARVPDSALVKNPLKSSNPGILLSSVPEPLSTPEERIRVSIESKMQKRHPDKDNTVLIIDNRISACGIDDYNSALEALKMFVDSTPFPEIWLYTGYCSDNDGNNAEFSFMPIKVTPEQSSILQKLIENNHIDEKRRIIWRRSR